MHFDLLSVPVLTLLFGVVVYLRRIDHSLLGYKQEHGEIWNWYCGENDVPLDRYRPERAKARDAAIR